MKSKFKEILSQTSYPLLLMILSYINLQYMHYSVLNDKYSLTPFSYIENISDAFIDVYIIFLIPIFLIKKRTYLYFVPYTLITSFCVINIWYSRYFYTYMPPALYLEHGNLNGISENILAAIKLPDIILLITTFLAILSYYKINKKYLLLKPKNRIKYVLLLTGAILLIKGGLVLVSQNKWTTLTSKYIKSYRSTPTESVFRYGIIHSIIVQSIMYNKEECDPVILTKLKPFFYNEENKIKNSPQNIIFILVESFLSFPSSLTFNDIEITPNLNRLSKEGAYYNNNMISQIALGESSDGQFIYINGLLPKKRGITIFDYFDNTFMSLPRLLKEKHPDIDCRMIIPTSSKMWRQDGICNQYKFDKLYSRLDYTLTECEDSWLNDKLLFEYAESIDRTRNKEPFFSFILTSSTHTPFVKEFESCGISFPDTYSREMKTYLSNLHYMDKYLGKYISSLKKSGIYDNTLIIIASDHSISSDWLELGNDSVSLKIPLYIINSPQKIEKKSDYPIAQVDVFPTILDLAGIKSKWRGVGNSLLTSDSILNTQREKERTIYREQISDIILNSNYFKSNNK